MNRLANFLFLVARDHVPYGALEQVMERIGSRPPNEPILYVGSGAAQQAEYARNLAERIEARPTDEVTVWLNASEIQALSAAMVGDFPTESPRVRPDLIRKLARASQEVEGR